MKSENDLRITGIIVTKISAKPEDKSIRFRIAHNFGGNRDPLILDCLLTLQAGVEVPKQGMHVRVRSYLRMNAGRIEAVVKSIEAVKSA